MKDNPTTLAAQIMEHYGAEHQQLKLCEECGELIQAAIKAHEIGADITTDFVGELADVYVLITQFIGYMPPVWLNEFNALVSFKLRRTIPSGRPHLFADCICLTVPGTILIRLAVSPGYAKAVSCIPVCILLFHCFLIEPLKLLKDSV